MSLEKDEISRVDLPLDSEEEDLNKIIAIYLKCSENNRHSEILWQIIKQHHQNLDLNDPSRSWVKFV